MKAKVNRVSIQIIEGDLLSLSPCVLVNATTPEFTLSPEWIAKGGAELQRECARIGHIELGSAVITGAGNLTVDKVIHAAGPRCNDGSQRDLLMRSVLECLRLAEQNKLKSIVFPPISTGEFGCTAEYSAAAMLTQIIDYTFEPLTYLRTVVICLEDSTTASTFKHEFRRQLEELRDTGDAKV